MTYPRTDQPAPPRKKRRALKITLIVLGVLIAMAIIGNLLPKQPKAGELHAADFDAWPFAVATATVSCQDGLPLVELDGTRYALTGAAHRIAPALAPENPLWLDDPGIEGAKVSIGPVIDEALKLC